MYGCVQVGGAKPAPTRPGAVVQIQDAALICVAAPLQMARTDTSCVDTRPAETIITSEKERLLARMDDIRSMLRDSKSLDVIEMLLQALADCEQRLAWAEGETAVTDPASPPFQAPADTPPTTPPAPAPGT